LIKVIEPQAHLAMLWQKGSSAMNEFSSQTRYGHVAMTLHWLIAVLLVGVGILGLIFESIPRASRMFYINLHTTIGLVMFGFVLLRILWRLTNPVPPADVSWSRLVIISSELTHKALYGLMLAVPIIGVIAYVWHGRIFDFGLFKLDFGMASAKTIYDPAEEIHSALAYGLFGLVGLHVLAALWHQFIVRDGIFRRILPL